MGFRMLCTNMAPSRHQAIILTSAEILLIGSMGTKFSGILIEINTISFKKMHLKMSSGKWRRFCLGLNVLIKESRMKSIIPKIFKPIRFLKFCSQSCLKSSNSTQNTSKAVQPKEISATFGLGWLTYFGSNLWNDAPSIIKIRLI